MAVIRFDPMIKSVSNKLGNFVYVSRNGQNFIRIHNPPGVPASQKQLEMQNAFGDTVALWKPLHPKLKESPHRGMQ